MTPRRFGADARGATAVEFASTFGLFAALIFGVFQVSLVLWTQLGIQNGVEAAARCAIDAPAQCPDAPSIQKYAAQNALGLGLPTSVFTTSATACGRLVSASYLYPLFESAFPTATIPLTAQYCLPS